MQVACSYERDTPRTSGHFRRSSKSLSWYTFEQSVSHGLVGVVAIKISLGGFVPGTGHLALVENPYTRGAALRTE